MNLSIDTVCVRTRIESGWRVCDSDIVSSLVKSIQGKGNEMAKMIVNNKTVGVAIKARKEFRNSQGSFTGILTKDQFLGTDRLPEEWRKQLRDAIVVCSDPVFVVYSYNTPIAWYANGEWTIPDVSYSPVTSRQQSKVRFATR